MCTSQVGVMCATQPLFNYRDALATCSEIAALNPSFHNRLRYYCMLTQLRRWPSALRPADRPPASARPRSQAGQVSWASANCRQLVAWRGPQLAAANPVGTAPRTRSSAALAICRRPEYILRRVVVHRIRALIFGWPSRAGTPSDSFQIEETETVHVT